MNQSHNQWLLIVTYISFCLFCGLEAWTAWTQSGASTASWVWTISALLWAGGCVYLLIGQLFGSHVSDSAGRMKEN